MMLMRCVCVFSSLYKGICCGYPFELQGVVDAIQMSIHKIGLHKETDKKYTGCNVKTTELLDCALIGVCDKSSVHERVFLAGYTLFAIIFVKQTHGKQYLDEKNQFFFSAKNLWNDKETII